MAPKNLLKEAFKNLYRQKSMNTLAGRRGEAASSQTNSPAEPTRPQSAPLYKEDSPDEDNQVPSRTQDREEGQTDEAIVAASQENEPKSISTSPESTGEKAEVYDNFYWHAVDEAKGHLDTVNLALALLEAFHGMSPHIPEAEKQLNARKEKCEKHLEWLKEVRGQASEVQIAGGWGDHAGGQEGKAAWSEWHRMGAED